MTTAARKRTVDIHHPIAAAITNRLGRMVLMIVVAIASHPDPTDLMTAVAPANPPDRMETAIAAIANRLDHTNLMVEDNVRIQVRHARVALR